MIHEVRRHFDDFVSKTFEQHLPIKEFLLKHERRQVCFENICKEVIEVERRGKVKLDPLRFGLLVQAVAKTFCKIAIDAKKVEMESQNEKVKQLMEASKRKIAEDLLKDAEKEAENVKKGQTSNSQG